MNQLRGKHVNLVLAVDNGRGMEFVKHPINVAGNYNGRILGWLLHFGLFLDNINYNGYRIGQNSSRKLRPI